MKKRCDLCQYWGEKAADDWEDSGAEMHVCWGIKARWIVADEASEDLDRFDDTEEWTLVRSNALKAEKAVVVDGSQYHAELLTQADFFCAKFEPNEMK